MTYHAAVWLDHREAHVFSISKDAFTRKTLRTDDGAKVHTKAGQIGSGHREIDHRFLDEIAQAASDAHEIYLCGPGTAKTELEKHLLKAHPDIARRIVKVAAADHPTDGELVAEARKFFKAFDRTTA